MPFKQDIKHYLTCRKALLVEQPTIEFHQAPNPGAIPQPCLCAQNREKSLHALATSSLERHETAFLTFTR